MYKLFKEPMILTGERFLLCPSPQLSLCLSCGAGLPLVLHCNQHIPTRGYLRVSAALALSQPAWHVSGTGSPIIYTPGSPLGAEELFLIYKGVSERRIKVAICTCTKHFCSSTVGQSVCLLLNSMVLLHEARCYTVGVRMTDTGPI